MAWTSDQGKGNAADLGAGRTAQPDLGPGGLESDVIDSQSYFEDASVGSPTDALAAGDASFETTIDAAPESTATADGADAVEPTPVCASQAGAPATLGKYPIDARLQAAGPDSVVVLLDEPPALQRVGTAQMWSLTLPIAAGGIEKSHPGFAVAVSSGGELFAIMEAYDSNAFGKETHYPKRLVRASTNGTVLGVADAPNDDVWESEFTPTLATLTGDNLCYSAKDLNNFLSVIGRVAKPSSAPAFSTLNSMDSTKYFVMRDLDTLPDGTVVGVFAAKACCFLCGAWPEGMNHGRIIRVANDCQTMLNDQAGDKLQLVGAPSLPGYATSTELLAIDVDGSDVYGLIATETAFHSECNTKASQARTWGIYRRVGSTLAIWEHILTMRVAVGWDTSSLASPYYRSFHCVNGTCVATWLPAGAVDDNGTPKPTSVDMEQTPGESSPPMYVADLATKAVARVKLTSCKVISGKAGQADIVWPRVWSSMAGTSNHPMWLAELPSSPTPPGDAGTELTLVRTDLWGNKSCEESGVCFGLPLAACNDKNPCTVDGCTGKSGCWHENVKDGTPCSATASCTSGACTGFYPPYEKK